MAPFGLPSPKCRVAAACSSHSDCFPWLPRLQSWLQLPTRTENPCASSFCSGFSTEFQTLVPNCPLYTSIYMSLRNLRFILFLTAFISFQPDFSSWTLCEYCHCPGSQPLFTTSSQSSTVQRWGGGGGYVHRNPGEAEGWKLTCWGCSPEEMQGTGELHTVGRTTR